MSIPPQAWSFTKRHQRFFKTKECLAACDNSPCRGRIVRAHIIPRSQLKQIARSGRIIAVPTSLLAIMKMQRTKFEAKEIGVSEFSTLNCFCAAHDKKLFAPIEDAPLALSSEQLALLHYRAIAAEFYQRNNQQESAASELDFESEEEPRNFRFSWIYNWSAKAFQEAHSALVRTEKLIEARQFTDVSSLIVRFDAPPSVMAAGAFRPQYDFAAHRVQSLVDKCCYVAMHMLAADGTAVLAFTWLKTDAAPERFVRTFAARPQKQMASLAVQCAFEHIEHTCMSETWWSNVKRPKQSALIERVRRANSLAYRCSPRCLSYRIRYADWPVADIDCRY